MYIVGRLHVQIDESCRTHWFLSDLDAYMVRFGQLFQNCFQLCKRIFLKFHPKNTVFGISFNFSQHVLAEYCSYDLHNPGACRVDMGLSPAQIWCQYLEYFSRGVDLNIFFSLNPVLRISAFIFGFYICGFCVEFKS